MPATRRPFALAATALFAALAGALVAGPLTPPAGPVTSTYKTLSEVEPRIAINAANTPGDAGNLFRITQPGSYYFTGNITGVAAKTGILIAASGVTIDLMGFTFQGVAGSLDGITNGPGNADNVSLVNGVITGWGSDGLQLNSGTNHHVLNVQARSNGGWGIIVDENGLVESCTASANGAGGVDCNGQNGIVRSCAAYGNTLQGILIFQGGVVEACAAYTNATGIQVGIGTTVIGCSGDNTADGFSVGGACNVRGCSAYSNGDDGIAATSASTTIANCVASFNGTDGIEAPGDCVLLSNQCDGNGATVPAAGIRIFGGDCRVEGNTMTRNDVGLEAVGGANIIIRNTCAGNTTDWSIAANNNFGPIIDRRVPASAAVSGFSAASTLGSTDPNANFSY